MTLFGTFESHITVTVDSSDEMEIQRLQLLVTQMHMKLTVIMLSNGDYPKQIMTNHQQSNISLCEYQYRVVEMTSTLKEFGFNPIRVKIEASARNPGLQDYIDTNDCKSYFEFHFKILLNPTNQEMNQYALQCLVKSLPSASRLHLSHSVYQKLDHQNHHIFVTLRNYGQVQVDAVAEFKSVLARLRTQFKVVKYEQEYVVLDTNFNLDLNWT